MELVTRIAQVIVPVFLIVAIGFTYARRTRPDMAGFNRIVLDVLSPVIVYTALAGKDFDLRAHLPLLLGGALLRSARASPARAPARARCCSAR